MNSRPNLRSIACLGLLPILFLFACPGSLLAASKPKVDLEEAKAELAKAKALKTAGIAPEAEPEPEQTAASPPRKRLFSFGKKAQAENSPTPASEQEPSAAPQPAAEPEESQPAATEEAPRRFRLFGSKPSKAETIADEPAVDEAGSVEEADKGEDEPVERRKFSLFRKKDEPAEPAAEAESIVGQDRSEPDATELAASDVEAKPTALEAEPRQADPGRKRLFGGLFTKQPAAQDSEAAVASIDPPPVEVPAPAPQENEESTVADERPAIGGSLFGFLRRDAGNGNAEAEKTKLGNSLDNDASASGAGAVAKQERELGWYVITESKTPFYAIGPGQPLPPEKVLDRGSMLTVTKGGWGWCNVKLGSGELGVVATKSMRPATVAEISRKNQGSATASRSSGSRSLFNILGRGPAPKPELPSSSGSEPIRNFGLLPPIDSTE